MNRFRTTCLLFLCVPMLWAGAPVVDLSDLPLEVQLLIETVEQAKTAIDQLETLMDTYEHWQHQATKIGDRERFTLRDLKQFLASQQVNRFYQGPAEFQRLIEALDGELDLNQVPAAFQSVFPRLKRVDEMNLGDFRIGLSTPLIEGQEQAFALAELGTVHTLAAASEGKHKLTEDRQAYDTLFDRWLDPEYGEQESLDTIHLQLAMIQDSLQQEQSLLQASLQHEAGRLGRHLQQQKAAYEQLGPLLRRLSLDADAFVTPSGHELLLP